MEILLHCIWMNFPFLSELALGLGIYGMEARDSHLVDFIREFAISSRSETNEKKSDLDVILEECH